MLIIQKYQNEKHRVSLEMRKISEQLANTKSTMNSNIWH
jgi:hypothetical protein